MPTHRLTELSADALTAIEAVAGPVLDVEMLSASYNSGAGCSSWADSSDHADHRSRTRRDRHPILLGPGAGRVTPEGSAGDALVMLRSIRWEEESSGNS